MKNKIKIIFFILLVAVSWSFTKKTTSTINWKVGDLKQIDLHINAKEIKNGVVRKDTTLTIHSSILIKSATESNFLIHSKVENLIVKYAGKYSDEVLKRYPKSYIETDIRVSKDSLSAELLDKNKYYEDLKRSYDRVLEVIKTYSPDSLQIATKELGEMLSSLKPKSSSQQIMELILATYKIKYSINDTLYSKDSLSNPFNLKNFTGAKEKIYTEKLNSRMYNIIVEKEYDFDAYKKMLTNLSDMATKAAKGAIQEAGVKIDTNHRFPEGLGKWYQSFIMSFNFDASELIKITINRKSNWPDKILNKVVLEMSSASEKSYVSVNIMCEIN